MKVIFLDFDGVITIPPKWNINIDKLKQLKKIIDATGAKIVISSSWRSGVPPSLDKTIEIIVGHTKRCPKNKIFNWFINNLYDVTPVYLGQRGDEIKEYLNQHPEVDNYLILDDDSDMLDEQVFNFIETDYQTGLTEHEVELGIKVLNNEQIYNSLGLNFILRTEWIKKCEGLQNKWETLIKYKKFK